MYKLIAKEQLNENTWRYKISSRMGFFPVIYDVRINEDLTLEEILHKIYLCYDLQLFRFNPDFPIEIDNFDYYRNASLNPI